jgi:6-phosphogluconolactonase (cycloisomerase 2 family)
MACNGNPFNSDLRAYKVDQDTGMLAEEPLINQGNSVGASSMVLDNFGGKNYIYVSAGVSGEVTAYITDEEQQKLKFINAVLSSGPGTALCWMAQYGDYLYLANAAGQSISSYLIQRDSRFDDAGRVQLVSAVAADITADTGGQGTLPFDFENFLYVFLAGSGNIATYIIEGDGESHTYDSMIGGMAVSVDQSFLNVGQGLVGANFASDALVAALVEHQSGMQLSVFKRLNPWNLPGSLL